MIDLHSHILPGIDDGARTLEESLEIALAAARDGTSVIAGTPHVRDDYPTAAQTIELGRPDVTLSGIAGDGALVFAALTARTNLVNARYALSTSMAALEAALGLESDHSL